MSQKATSSEVRQAGRSWSGVSWVTMVAAGLCVAMLAGASSVAWPSSAQEAERSPCAVTPAKWADPTVLDELGDTTTIRLTLEESCPAERAPVDVILVLDKSASMHEIASSNNRSKLDNVKEAAVTFVDSMDMEQSRVGLVAFNHQVGLRVALTADGKRVQDSVKSLLADGQTNVTDAIRLAKEHLVDSSTPDRNRAMIVLTDGIHNATNEPLTVAATEAKAAGIDVVTICAGSRSQCDASLSEAASNPSLFFLVEDASNLVDLYRRLAEELQQNAIAELTVTDVVPANMRYIVNSAEPPLAELLVDVPSTGYTTLIWRLYSGMPDDGLTYELEPLAAGTHPTNVTAVGDFIDRRGLAGDTVFPVPEVFVPGPVCPPQGLEVYFLIDDSTCLFGSTLNDMLALEAIARGIERNLDKMSLGRDKVAVIGFGDTARVYQELSTDKNAILAAVRRIAMLDRSARLDLAYQEVRREVERNPEHDPTKQFVVVSITDGPMMAAPDRAQARARHLRELYDAKHYTIGVGPIVQHTMLRLIAEPGGYEALPLGGDVIGALERLGDQWTPFGPICPEPIAPTPGVPVEPTATAEPTVSVPIEPLALPAILNDGVLRD